MTIDEAITRLKGLYGNGYMEQEQALDMAINALDKEPCDDAISRKATVERLCKVAEFMNEKRDGLGSPYVMAALFIQDNKDEFPSVTPQPKWIPVSERLPEDGDYLVTIESIDGTLRIDMRSFAKDLNKVDKFDFPKHKCGWYDYDSEYGYWEDTKVIAWMPLQKPYKADKEEK